MQKRRGKRRHKRRRQRAFRNKMLVVVILMAVICSWKDIKTVGRFLAGITGEDTTQIKNAVNNTAYSGPSEEEERKGGAFITMKGLSQDEIPTGCESVSTVMGLQYMGIDISPEEFINEYLPCENFWKENGKIYGPDPDEYFAGNPFEAGSLGCFPRVIMKALEAMKDENYPGMSEIRYKNVSGEPLYTLAKEYIARKIPVIVWVTIDMEPSYEGMEYYLKDGSLYVWRAREHCMVLCGYDEENYYLMDPLSDGRMVIYDMETVEARYEELGRNAVVLYR